MLEVSRKSVLAERECVRERCLFVGLLDLHVTANGSSSLLPRRRMQDRSLSCNREGLCASGSPAGALVTSLSFVVGLGVSQESARVHESVGDRRVARCCGFVCVEMRAGLARVCKRNHYFAGSARRLTSQSRKIKAG